MPDDPSTLSCEGFQNALAESMASGADIANHPHAKACSLCRGLVRDLYRIAENARHFRFGVEELDSDDWSEST